MKESWILGWQNPAEEALFFRLNGKTILSEIYFSSLPLAN